MPKSLLQTAIEKSLPTLPLTNEPIREEHSNPMELKFTADEIALLRKSWGSSQLNSGKGSKSSPHSKSSSSSSSGNSNRKSSKLQSTSMMFGSAYFWIEVYEALVKRDPDVILYMPTAKHQTVQFSSIMLTAMENLEDLSSLQFFLQKLGSMHARVFSVEQHHFEQMGQALLQVLLQRVKDLGSLSYG
ncbi:unnamed protein product [Ambrosiozyma monospora]|uniref:Unnamed protein product n=1 Tax=Ambrosiozyma monospora TaxID=43982 RepID=A0ACB5TSN5_AMBMO|nr:unnamed protein product [Ambrosiozyma monospora]